MDERSAQAKLDEWLPPAIQRTFIRRFKSNL
jgi:hypothetical protein